MVYKNTHALCIATDTELLYPTKINFFCEDFGKTFSTYFDLQSRANYLYTAFQECDKTEQYKETVSNALMSMGISCEFSELKGGKIYNNKNLSTNIDCIMSDRRRLIYFLLGIKSQIRISCDGGNTYLQNTFSSELDEFIKSKNYEVLM